MAAIGAQWEWRTRYSERRSGYTFCGEGGVLCTDGDLMFKTFGRIVWYGVESEGFDLYQVGSSDPTETSAFEGMVSSLIA